jgi:signal transduction histidine kinase
MRARLTVWFVVLTLVLTMGLLLLRFYTVGGLVRAHESDQLRRQTAALALVFEQRAVMGTPVDEAFLAKFVSPDQRAEYDAPDGPDILVEGVEYSDGNADEDIEAIARVGEGTLTFRTSSDVISRLILSDLQSVVVLLALIGLMAAFGGFLISRVVSAPFRQLAGAADQLGRGRFDLDLPRTKIPEARAIGTALKASAGQLQDRLTSELAFAEHASHVLRTPLTGLRLELEDLATRDDVPADVRVSAQRSVGRIQSMDGVAGELVQLSRRPTLVDGAQVPLRDLATLCAQKWADTLAEQNRSLSAAVEGHLEMTYTPGPVEHVLDLLLRDFLKRGAGPVRMVFEADAEGHLKIKVVAAAVSATNPGLAPEVYVTQARAVVTALGGRLTGDNPHGGLDILLPRR